MPMNRVKCPWTGFTGGPGLSTLYIGSTTFDVAPIKSFFNSVTTWIPNVVTITIPAVGDVINETDGSIVGAWAGTGGGTALGSVTPAAYSGASGAVIDWLTALVIAGRRRQGRTFLVPLGGVAYENNGTLATGVLSSLQTAANTLISAYAGELKVFSRPFVPKPGSTKPPRVGASVSVISARIPDMAAVLRSRRA